jgi:type VI secretion system protein VasD
VKNAQLPLVSIALMSALTLAACSTVGDVVGTGLEKLGLKQPTSIAEAKAMVPLTKDVTLRIHAGEALNVDAESRPLSVVVRVYRLKSADAFVNAPLAAFKDAESEKSAFGPEVVDVREVVLTPRQKYEVVEALGHDVKYIAVVALFRAPSPGRWRFAFEKDAAARPGVTLGAHACALSVAAGQAHGAAPELTRLVGARCS